METTTLTTWLVPFFWLAAFIVFYTYLGYGIVLYLLVKIKGYVKKEQVVSDLDHVSMTYPDVTLVIAAYNEEAIIPEKMQNCHALVYPEEKLHFLWVTDGSDDDSNVLLKQYREVTLVYH